MSARQASVRDIAQRLIAVSDGTNMRVAIDGRTASGKTTFADELGEELAALGRTAIRASVDGFHRPRAERYRRGRMSAEGYYRDARDHDAIVSLLLRPLAPGSDRLIRTQSFDLASDEPLNEEPQLIDADAILIVDGTFLQRPELAEHWDAVIFIDTDPALCLERGVQRDADGLGGQAPARLSYESRYQPAYELYETEAQPERTADVLVDNNNPADPHTTIRPDGRLGPP
ncbi:MULTISPECIES: uridylate kinase [unclassified Microbacterium]|uniref:uridylate kinase n=1 Tax=unclassified Microbacterium TaxID=2609290 RepID=UPI000EA9B874|nr:MULTISPECIES: uridylate kinase [unclassified Microbacterium]MBT2483543.1 uridine kinase [Microbacterium sp. ISL-108]RKN66556.1 uridylate kinase [Microbacterium sp. CGR2]